VLGFIVASDAASTERAATGYYAVETTSKEF
jgi:hypothetical protein